MAKCEYLNPGGSVKDRIGRRMVVDAEISGRIKRGDTLIEPTSGNTGIGLAMTAAAKGYNMIITLPEKMSQEKSDVLVALGSTVIRTPTEMPFDHVGSHIGIAIELQKILERAHILDQYKNPGNPLAHYDETGQEIYDQCGGKVDYVVVSAGTGGQITGISRKLKELDPNIQVVGVDPNGSILAQPEILNKEGVHGYKVEGIGYDFIPRVLDRQYVDKWLKTDDTESFEYARRLIKEEGMLVGGSSGCAMAAAVRLIKELNIGAGKRVVVLLPDSVRNYITKFINNDWMYENGFITEDDCTKLSNSTLVPSKDWGQDFTVGDLSLTEAIFLPAEMSAREAIDEMQKHNFDQFPVMNAEGTVIGCLTSTILTTKLIKKKLTLEDKIEKSVVKEFRSISSTTKLNELGRVLGRHTFALVDNKFVVSSFDLLNFMKKQCQ